jgi:hypothetical protein
MGRFLTALPSNIGFVNLGLVETYPTGGSGPTAFGPTSYFGSDPLPERLGDSVNNPVNLGSIGDNSRNINISNTHGGLSRLQSFFYKFTLEKPNAVQILQNFSLTSYESSTNKNTVISVYKVENGTHRRELIINNDGYVCNNASIDYNDSYDLEPAYSGDYPSTTLDIGTYIILITNDIRFLETTYSITVSFFLNDWRYVGEFVTKIMDFGLITQAVDTQMDFGPLTN